MMIHGYVVDIYEQAAGDAYPVVQHEFFGRERDEATGYFDAHMGTDTFMRDCVRDGHWKDVQCRAVGAWRAVEDGPEAPAPIGKKSIPTGIVAFVVDIFEKAAGDDYPVVRHVFFGKDRPEALGYYNAHLGTCAFLKGCVESGHWEDVTCRAQARWFEGGSWLDVA